MYPGAPMIYVFDKAPRRIHVMPAPGLFALIVAADAWWQTGNDALSDMYTICLVLACASKGSA
eukprot:8958510-Pyramimonas_sp.AAC.1